MKEPSTYSEKLRLFDAKVRLGGWDLIGYKIVRDPTVAKQYLAYALCDGEEDILLAVLHKLSLREPNAYKVRGWEMKGYGIFAGWWAELPILKNCSGRLTTWFMSKYGRSSDHDATT